MERKLDLLRGIFEEMGSVLVAFSGGIDSALVLRVAHDVLGGRACGLTATGPALADRDRADAARIAAEIGVRHLFVDSLEIEVAGYRRNEGDRCYFCKTELYRRTAQALRDFRSRWAANRTTVAVRGDHRPGLGAADDDGVSSPRAEALAARGPAVAFVGGSKAWAMVPEIV